MSDSTMPYCIIRFVVFILAILSVQCVEKLWYFSITVRNAETLVFRRILFNCKSFSVPTCFADK